jgi:ribosome biogenesis protein Nip4
MWFFKSKKTITIDPESINRIISYQVEKIFRDNIEGNVEYLKTLKGYVDQSVKEVYGQVKDARSIVKEVNTVLNEDIKRLETATNQHDFSVKSLEVMNKLFDKVINADHNKI